MNNLQALAYAFLLLNICSFSNPTGAQMTMEAHPQSISILDDRCPKVVVPIQGREILAQSSSSFERRRNRKALGCVGLVAGTWMRIQSRSVYNDYLTETDETTRQSLYEQANGLHQASLITMALSSVVFVIPLGKAR